MNESIDPSLSHTPQLGGIHNRFGADLLESALKKHGKNALLSPTSIAILLAMLHAGARGKSRNAIETTLGTGRISNLQEATAAFLAHLRSFSDTDDLELLSANGMWGQTGYVFDPDYVRIVRDTYDGEIIHKAAMYLDEEGTEAAAVTIANMLGGSAMDEPPPVIVQVDRPFLFAIRDNTSGANLFLGQVHNPTAD